MHPNLRHPPSQELTEFTKLPILARNPRGFISTLTTMETAVIGKYILQTSLYYSPLIILPRHISNLIWSYSWVLKEGRRYQIISDPMNLPSNCYENLSDHSDLGNRGVDLKGEWRFPEIVKSLDPYPCIFPSIFYILELKISVRRWGWGWGS